MLNTYKYPKCISLNLSNSFPKVWTDWNIRENKKKK